MFLTIKGKEEELKFGVGFVRDMDKRNTKEVEGIEFGFGLAAALGVIEETGGIETYLEIVQSALKRKYTIDDIADAIDELDEEEQVSFLERLSETLKKAPVVQASQVKVQEKMTTK